MAQYTVTAKGCGHTTTLQLYGPMDDRRRRIAWMESETGLCNACYAQKKQREGREARIEEKVAQLLLHPDAVRAQRGQVEVAIAKGQIDADNAEVFRRVLALLGVAPDAGGR